jgi:hypothetical protein
MILCEAGGSCGPDQQLGEEQKKATNNLIHSILSGNDISPATDLVLAKSMSNRPLITYGPLKIPARYGVRAFVAV